MKLFSKFYLIFISFRLIVQYNAHSINESNKLPVMHRQIMEAAAILFQTKFISSAQRETICRLKFIKNRGNSARQTISIDARICESGIYIPVEREMVIIANYQPMFSGALSIGNLRLRKKYWKKKTVTLPRQLTGDEGWASGSREKFNETYSPIAMPDDFPAAVPATPIPRSGSAFPSCPSRSTSREWMRIAKK